MVSLAALFAASAAQLAGNQAPRLNSMHGHQGKHGLIFFWGPFLDHAGLSLFLRLEEGGTQHCAILWRFHKRGCDVSGQFKLVVGVDGNGVIGRGI